MNTHEHYRMAMQCLACAFFAILFIQSGIDKVTDRKGNLDYLSDHFATSPLKGSVPMLLNAMTVLEIFSGASSALAIFSILASGPPWIPFGAICLCCVSFLCLFAGQRIAKDYAGAATLAIYMGVALLSLNMML